MILNALQAMLKDPEVFGRDSPCPVLYEDGAESSRILLVTGENAGGKTLACRYVAAVMRRLAREAAQELEVMHLGMQMRSEPGMARAFVFGDESCQSTGEITAHSLAGAVQNSAKRKNAHLLCLDEPDVGLSEGYQAAAGDLLAEYGRAMPPLAAGLIVVTHSRPVASRLFALSPRCLRVGDDLRPTSEWLEKGPPPRSRADLDALPQRAAERFRAVSAIEHARVRRRREEGGPERGRRT